jgi:hypothetical protein
LCIHDFQFLAPQYGSHAVSLNVPGFPQHHEPYEHNIDRSQDPNRAIRFHVSSSVHSWTAEAYECKPAGLIL